MKALTTINLDSVCTYRTKKEEDDLELVRIKTGLGYKTSNFKSVQQPNRVDSSKITERLTREVQKDYRLITGADKYKPYFERHHPNVGSENFDQTRDLNAEEAFNRSSLVNQILRIPTCSLQRHQLEALSMDRLIRLVEKIGERV